jgi:para-aminobenzoate synthetase/4-amino-4-deoxychorismate lyase
MDSAWFDSDDPVGEGWGVRLEEPIATHVTAQLDDVEAVLSKADQAARDGLWAAVAVSYEAAAAFEPRLLQGAPGAFGRSSDEPLIWTGIYRSGQPGRSDRPDRSDASSRSTTFVPAIDAGTFAARVRAAQEHIHAGDTYQVNLTFPMHAADTPDPADWYRQLRAAQRARYCARLDLGTHVVLSFSPELFFERRGDLLTARPMKGTAARGRWRQEDEQRARDLAASEKERAENVMIVDLLRNDIGRVALPGTVRARDLYRVERYPTLWQMTSAVEGRLPAGTPLTSLFRALFPCGSVTGAPKIRTMEIIAALEQRPRRLYTGAIGFVRPGGDCVFSVAIRTIVIDRHTGAATMGVGAGITADSVAQREYDECLLKAAFTHGTPAEGGSGQGFLLLETMRLEQGCIARVNRHLARMADSASYFGFTWDETSVRRAVEDARVRHADGCWRLRLVVDRRGQPDVTCTAHEPGETRVWRVTYADTPVDDRSPFLFNKTTNRRVYEKARRKRPDVDDVLLWNGRGEITESTIANLVADLDGARVTPPVECGLLAGTYRAELIAAGVIRERVLTRDDLARASRIWLINSLRGWIEAAIVL